MTKKRPAKKTPARKSKPTPKRVGAVTVAKDVNRLLDLKRQLDVASAKLKPLKDRYGALEEHVLQRYSAEELSSVKTKKGLVARTESVVPDLKDFTAFYEFVRDNNAPELLRKQVNHDAWKERVEQGHPVPGVEPFTRVGLQVRLGGKK